MTPALPNCSSRSMAELMQRAGATRFLCHWIVAAGLCLPQAMPAAPALAQASDLPRALEHLVAAYPALLWGIDGNMLVWKDGTRMVIDDGRGLKAHDQRLETADIKDMFYSIYPAGKP